MEIKLKLSDKDLYFKKIEQLIHAKREFLLDKQRKIKDISVENKFLVDVKNDYAKYSQYIVSQKKDQIQALDILNNYINDLSVSGTLSKNNLKDAKYEQKQIVDEINNIKKNLDEIMDSMK